MQNEPNIPVAQHAPAPDEESPEVVFAQAAKDYHRTPIIAQDAGFVSWLGWLWLPLLILSKFRR
jgi:hypothetical protein